jgi:glutamate dehydrogenase (NAD(P)+)
MASGYTDVPKDLLDYYKKADATIKFHIPLIRDDGSLDTVAAYRA